MTNILFGGPGRAYDESAPPPPPVFASPADETHSEHQPEPQDAKAPAEAALKAPAEAALIIPTESQEAH